MRRSRLLGYALFCGLVGILVSAFANSLFPIILNSRSLFEVLVALLLAGGLVSAVISARKMSRR